jgi:hypothetical protein
MINSDFVEASFDTLLTQASDTAATYMRAAQREVDAQFGAGYAAKHPELVIAFMQAASSDFNTSSTAKVFGASMLRISESLSAIADRLEK